MRDATQRVLRGGRLSVALLLSAAMTFGGAPAVAIAEDASVSPEGVESEADDVTTKVGISNEDGTVSRQINGNIVVTGGGHGVTVVNAPLDETKTDVALEVGGNVTVTATEGDGATGIVVVNINEGDSTVTVAGSVEATSAQGHAVGVMAGAIAAGSADVSVGGDVSGQGGEQSVGLQIAQIGDGKVDVTVGGTVRGGQAVDVTEVKDFSNVNLTVWKLESADGAPAVAYEEGQKGVSGFLESIKYIIKVADGKLGDGYDALGLAFKNANDGTTEIKTKQGTANYKTFSLKNDNEDMLRFTVTAPAGKRVKAVYGRHADAAGVSPEAADVPLEKDGDTYLLSMADGNGGIMIFVEYEDAPADDKGNTDLEENGNENPEEKKGQAKPEDKAEQTMLPGTGPAARGAEGLPATGDAASTASVAALALAGSGALLAGRRTRRE